MEKDELTKKIKSSMIKADISQNEKISSKKSLKTILFRQKNKMGLKKFYQAQRTLEKTKTIVNTTNERRISITGIKKPDTGKKPRDFNEISNNVKTVIEFFYSIKNS